MKQLLLLVVISSFAIGMVGCKGGDDAGDTAVTTPSGGTAGGGAATAPPAANPNKAGMPSASTAVPTLAPNANDSRWKAGTMIKGGK